jgi:hypothetical protein
VSKLAVFLIRLATDPEVRDQFRNPKTRSGLIAKFANKNALSKADIVALNQSDVSEILGAIAASNQQTDGTAVRVTASTRRRAKPAKGRGAKKK